MALSPPRCIYHDLVKTTDFPKDKINLSSSAEVIGKKFQSLNHFLPEQIPLHCYSALIHLALVEGKKGKLFFHKLLIALGAFEDCGKEAEIYFTVV